MTFTVSPQDCLLCFLHHVPIFGNVPVPVLIVSSLVDSHHLSVISSLPYLNSLFCASHCLVLRLYWCVSTPHLCGLPSFRILLKGSYDVAKKNIILSMWCNAMCLCGLRFKKHIIFHILYIIVAPFCSAFLKRADFYKAHRSEKRGVLWLASYPVRCDWPNTSSVRRKCYRIVMRVRRDDTKTIKPIINEAFVASIGDVITDYNDLYCLFITWPCLHLWSEKQQALLYTAQNSRLNRQKQIL